MPATWHTTTSGSTLRKDVRSAVQAACDQGARWRRTGSGHVLIQLSGGGTVTISATASDHRSHANIVGDLRRAGIVLRT